MESKNEAGRKKPSKSLIVLIVLILIFMLGVYFLPEPNPDALISKPSDLELIEGPTPAKEPAQEDIPPSAPPAPPPDTQDIPEIDADDDPTPTSLPPDPQMAKRISASAYKDVIPPGGALLTGGWKGQDGARTFTLIEPTPVEGEKNQVMISGLVFSIASDKLKDDAWQAVLADQTETLNLKGATYNPKELAAFKENYQTEFSSLLSAPKILALYGTQATIEISGYQAGLAISVIANSHDDGIELGVSMLDWEGGKLPRAK